MGYGLIATAGAVDSHVHLISPELLPAALSGGVTTILTAGFEEPPWAMQRTFDTLSGWPLNVGLQACARAEDDGVLETLLDAGSCGFKIHEDYGAHPELIDHVAPVRRCARHRRRAPHRRAARVSRARGHRRRDRGADRPRLSRRGEWRRPRPGPDRARPRGQHPLLVDDADDPLRRQRRGRAGPDDHPQPRGVVRGRRGRGARPRAGPPGIDGGRGTAPRARRDRDRELRLAGDGPDDGDGATDDPARPRDAGLARDTGRSPVTRGCRRIGDDSFDANERVLRYLAKVTIEPAITHGIADACRVAGARSPRGHRPVAPGLLRRQARARAQGRRRRLGSARRGQRLGRTSGADALSAGLGRVGPCGRVAVGDVRVGSWCRGSRRCGPGWRRRVGRSWPSPGLAG